MSSTLETLASFVPPLFARRFVRDPAPLESPSAERFSAAVLFADISGFTALTERLAQRGSQGAEELSRVLDAYFEVFVDLIDSHGGQVINFPGDAAIVLWPELGSGDLPELTQRAAQCGLSTQAELNGYRVAHDVRLFLKIGLGVGEVWAASIGGVEGCWQFLLAGEPLQQIALVERHTESGDVVLSPEAWALLHQVGCGTLLRDGCVRLESLKVPVRPRPFAALSLLPEAETALRGYVPRPVLVSIDAGQTGWLAELRRVTIMFLNLKDLDFTSAGILDRVQAVTETIERSIRRHGGSINQFVADDKGTTLLAAWGLPACTHEDDAVLALRAALDIHAELEKLGTGSAIGIATGRVFCGERGSGRRREYAMIGDRVNLAARLMQAARDRVICDGPTHEAAQTSSGSVQLVFQALPGLMAKGKAAPVSVYRVRKMRDGPAAEDKARTLIGRQEEKRSLAASLQVLADGRGGAVIIEGEPGIGKSVLVADLLRQARKRRLTHFVGAGNGIEQSTSYHAWRAVFTGLLELGSQPDDKETRRRYVQRLLARLDEDSPRLAPLLNPVLALDFPENSLTSQMSGEVRAGNTQRLLMRLLTSVPDRSAARNGDVAEPAGLLIVLEDVHWLDSASWALVRRVLRDAPAVLVVLAARPLVEPVPDEFSQLLRSPGTQRIRLQPLPWEHTQAQLSDRLGVPSVADEIVDFVHQRAGGNPFFSEELAYALRDAGLILMTTLTCRIAPDAEDLGTLIPDSVQGTVASRIDLLSPPQQLALKVASVIGRVFAVRVLRDLYPVESERHTLNAHLDVLERLDLTLVEMPEPELAYLFKHIITQEVAYDMLLFSQRRELHQAVAEWYEKRNTDDLKPFYPILSHHWSNAEVHSKAIEYLDKAGLQALDSDANHEAIRFFSQACEQEEARSPVARRMPVDPPTMSRRASRQFRMAEAYYRLGLLPKAAEFCEQALRQLGYAVPATTAQLLRYTLMLVTDQVGWRAVPGLMSQFTSRGVGRRERADLLYQIHYLRLRIAFMNSNTNLTVHATLSSLRAAEIIGPSPQQAHAYATMSLACGVIPMHGLAQLYQRKALAAARRLEEEDSIDLGKILNSICVYTSGVGQWERTERHLTRAAQLLERFGDWTQWGISQQMLGRAAAHQGQFQRLAEISDRLMENAQRRDALLEQTWSLNNRIESLLFSSNDVARALELGDECFALVTATSPASELILQSLLAIAHARAGDLRSSRDAATQALAIIDDTQPTSFGLFVAYASTASALFACREIAVDEDVVLTRQLEAACKALNALARVFPIAQPRSFLYRGLLLWAGGRRANARRLWRKALRRARQLRMEYEVGLAYFEIGRHLRADSPAGAEQRFEHLSQALAVFTKLGVSYDEERVHAELDGS